MGFWSFMRDMIVIDWLFGQHKEKSSGKRSRREKRRHTDYPHNDDYRHRGYGGYSHNDHVQQDFDDDLDSGMFDDF